MYLELGNRNRNVHSKAKSFLFWKEFWKATFRWLSRKMLESLMVCLLHFKLPVDPNLLPWPSIKLISTEKLEDTILFIYIPSVFSLGRTITKVLPTWTKCSKLYNIDYWFVCKWIVMNVRIRLAPFSPKCLQNDAHL